MSLDNPTDNRTGNVADSREGSNGRKELPMEENHILEEYKKKADMKEGLRSLIMSAMDNALPPQNGKTFMVNHELVVRTLEALPGAISTYLPLSEMVPDGSIEEILSSKSL